MSGPIIAADGDRELCHWCAAETRWLADPRRPHLRCEGCGDVYPCAHRCRHLDCADARGEATPELEAPGQLALGGLS
jgi:hypothetical protein